MFTHHVSAERARAFKKFFGVRLVSRARLTADTDRAAYFETCSRARRHLFLDPDTGLRTREKLRRLQREDLAGFAYVSHVAFIVVGRDPALVKRARTTLLRRSRLPEDRIVVPAQESELVWGGWGGLSPFLSLFSVTQQVERPHSLH